MSTYVRSVSIEIRIDTNQRTLMCTYQPAEDETLPDLLRRLADEIVYEPGEGYSLPEETGQGT